MKTLHTVVAVVGIAIAGGAAWWYQNRPAAADAAVAEAPAARASGAGDATGRRGGAGGAAAVEVAAAEQRTLTEETSAVGTLRARQGVVVRPEVSGRIVPPLCYRIGAGWPKKHLFDPPDVGRRIM